ncbi:hypothetical protein ACP4OV_005908 [Aristida adscensionis]
MAEPRRKKKVKGEAATVLLPPDHVSEEIFLRLPPRSAPVRPGGPVSAPAASEALLVTSEECVDCPRVFSGAGKTCHGAVLAGRPCEGQFYVCNPCTGGVLRLPPRRPASCFDSAGLGYSAASGKLKAVLLERSWVPPWRSPGVSTERSRVVVLTVGEPQWRWPEQTREDVIGLSKTDPVFADGHLHWIEYFKGILSFAIDNESFRRIPPPPYAADDMEQRARQTARRSTRRWRSLMAVFALCVTSAPSWRSGSTTTRPAPGPWTAVSI